MATPISGSTCVSHVLPHMRSTEGSLDDGKIKKQFSRLVPDSMLEARVRMQSVALLILMLTLVIETTFLKYK